MTHLELIAATIIAVLLSVVAAAIWIVSDVMDDIDHMDGSV